MTGQMIDFAFAPVVILLAFAGTIVGCIALTGGFRQRTPDYGAALDQLDQMHRAGQISDSRYELHKAKLLAEATRRPLPTGVRILITVGAVVVVMPIVFAILRAILGSE